MSSLLVMPTATPRHEPSPHGRSAAILEAARRRYTRFGPRKTTMNEVAREAGCSRATLYAHFPSKQALYAGLLDAETQRFVGELEAIASSTADAARKLRRIVRATTQIYADSPILHAAVTGDDEMAILRVAGPAIAVYEAQVIDTLRQVLEQGMEAGVFRRIEPASVAYLMYHLGRVLVTRELVQSDEYPLSQILGVMDDLFALGLAGPQLREAT